MNLPHFLAILRARWLPALALALAVAIGVALYTWTAPRTYVAAASLLIEARPDPVSSMLYGGAGNPALINTQLEIIRSDRVTQRVIQNLKLTEMAEVRQMWSGSARSGITITEFATKMLQRGLEADVARPGSNVINIGFRATDGRFASTMANAFMQAYLETSIELRVDPAKQYSGFFNDQIKDAREQLEQAQAKLTAFQRAKGIVGSDDKFDLENSRLSLLTQELVAIQSQRVDTSTRQQQVGSNSGQLSEVLGSNTVASVKSEVAAAENKLSELTARYGDKHPAVVDARNTLEALRQRLATETRNVTGSLSVNANVSRAREAEVQAALEAQRAKVMSLKQVHDEGSVLARDVENSQRAYDMVYTRFNQTNLESQNRQSNATVISQAVPPTEPSSPKVMANLLMGAAVALGAGLGLALLLEQFDRRVRTPEDALAALGLPMLGVMPTPSMNRRLRGQLALTRDRVISGRRLPGPQKGKQ